MHTGSFVGVSASLAAIHEQQQVGSARLKRFLSAFVPHTPFPLLSLSARTYDTLMIHAVPALLISHSIS